MVALDVDFDVFKALTNRRATEDVTYNDVLRELLELGAKAPPSATQNSGGWSWKGVTLPNGTELKASHQGKLCAAKIENSKWMQDGNTYASPSAAAFAITNYGINGWLFWQVKRPSDATWVQLGSLRPKK